MRQYTFKGLSSNDTITITVTKTDNEMNDYIKAESQSTLELCEDVELIEQ